MKIRALDGRVLVDDIDRGERMYGKILLLNDDGTNTGVRCRWCHVYSVGSDITAVTPGEWVLVTHGNWTRSITIRDETNTDVTLWQINWPDGVLAAAEEPTTTWAGDQQVNAEKLKR